MFIKIAEFLTIYLKTSKKYLYFLFFSTLNLKRNPQEIAKLPISEVKNHSNI